MVMQADIAQLMDGELGSWLESQTGMRANAKAKAKSRWTKGAIVLLPILAFLWFVPSFFGDWKFIISAVGVIGVAIWGYLPIGEALETIKIGINSAIARQLGIEYQEDLDPGAEFEAAKQYGLVPSHDRSDFEDNWFGQIEDHDFGLYEAHLEERRGSGKNRRWVTVFRGAIIQMQFGRSFHSTTLLQRAGKHKKWFGLGGRKDKVSFKGHELAYVDQVHPAFENVFEVWSDDQVEARVLVHPSYVEHLLALERAFSGDAVRALFSKGEVIIAVQSKDLFESGSMDPSQDRINAEKTAGQFSALAKLALAINQSDRGRAMAAPDAKFDTSPSNESNGITEADREAAQRPSGGFGRKGL